VASAMPGRHHGALLEIRHAQRHLISFQISELLGSFGDNELSPECLDGAQRFLKHDGINIPVSYTALIAPVQTSRLWQVFFPFCALLLLSFIKTCVALSSRSLLYFALLQDVKSFDKADAWETAYDYVLFSFVSVWFMFRHLQLTHLQICCQDECKKASCF
jgi:hypothetical protein